MPSARGIEQRIDWFLSHNPSGSGMCAQHTWHSLGGDQGYPAAWGAANANQAVDKVKASGRYWTPSTWSGPPPRGAWVGYKYGSNGHACLSNGDGKITTTDPSNGKPTGTEDLNYPNKWGASGWDVWTDQYNGVRFDVGTPVDHGEVYLSKLVYGQEDSDSVKRLQIHLNAHKLSGGSELPVTGNYFDQTKHEINLCTDQHGYSGDGSSVDLTLAKHLISGCDCTLIDDLEVEPEPVPPEPETEPPPMGAIEYWYSGKPSGTLKIGAEYKKLDVPAWAPKHDGLTLSMLYMNVDGEAEFRVRLIRDPDDATAYQTYYAKAGDNLLLTHVWFESGEANRKLWWEIQTMDGETITIGTRYAKFATIPWG